MYLLGLPPSANTALSNARKVLKIEPKQEGTSHYYCVEDIIALARYVMGGLSAHGSAPTTVEELKREEAKLRNENLKLDLEIKKNSLINIDEARIAMGSHVAALARVIRILPTTIRKELKLDSQQHQQLQKIVANAVDDLASAVENTDDA